MFNILNTILDIYIRKLKYICNERYLLQIYIVYNIYLFTYLIHYKL